VNRHVGNVRFRSILDKYSQTYEYRNVSSKWEKWNIAVELVIYIQTTVHGRFLAKLPASEIPAGFDRSTELWYELDAISAAKKVAQRFREFKKEPEYNNYNHYV
jgi:hypothetical protein